jgi:hypothetical protein
MDYATSAAAVSNGGNAAVGIVLVLVSIVAYWVPTIVAASRRGAVNTGSIVVINLFLGWTVVGWVIALAMACRSRPQQPAYVVPPGWAPSGPGPGWTPPDAGPVGWAPPPAPQGPADPGGGYR